MLTRVLLAAIFGIAVFVAVSGVGFSAACHWSSVAGCTESLALTASLLSLTKTGAIVMAAGLLIVFLAHKRARLRHWALIPVYLLLGAVIPWLLAGPRIHTLSSFDLVFPLAGLAMGIIMLLAFRTRSNNSFKPNPLRGSA